jgi:hypothetical protein
LRRKEILGKPPPDPIAEARKGSEGLASADVDGGDGGAYVSGERKHRGHLRLESDVTDVP